MQNYLLTVCVCSHQARLEVHRFGITGYKKEQQRVFEQDRAVMLGARVKIFFFKCCAYLISLRTL